MQIYTAHNVPNTESRDQDFPLEEFCSMNPS